MFEFNCRNGIECNNSKCGFKHPDGWIKFINDKKKENKKKNRIKQKNKKLEYMKNTLCWLGNNCKNKKCGFYHPVEIRRI